jgi:hypothetical protein
MPASELFETELRRRRVEFARADDGRYRLQVAGGELLVSLDNLERDFDRDGDPGAVVFFVDRVLGARALPDANAAREQIFWSAERFDNDFGDCIHEAVSQTVVRVLVVTNAEHSLITWLTPKHLQQWNLSLDEARSLAGRNLDALLADKQLETMESGDKRLGMIPVEPPFKASCIFAPGLQRFVSALGWPVLVVIPCRDFVFVLNEEDRELLDRLGAVVQREFRESGYPITTEVLRLSDDGIEAIGAFPE